MIRLLPVALACAAPGPEATCPDGSASGADGACPEVTDTGPWGGALDAQGGPEAPTWTAAEALDRLSGALASGMVQSPTVMETYEEFIAHREGTCPSMGDPGLEGPSGAWQSDDCTTSEDWRFQGLAIYNEFCSDGSDPDSKDPGVGRYEGGMLSHFVMTDPQGNEFQGGGILSHSCRWHEDGSGECLDDVGGVYLYQGAASWLGSLTEASLFVNHAWGGAKGRRTSLDGGVGYPDLALSFEGVVLDWEGCGGQATGRLGVRDPSGYWHELVFDEDCSGCGDMTWRNLDEGRQCVDLAAVLTPVIEAWETPCWQ